VTGGEWDRECGRPGKGGVGFYRGNKWMICTVFVCEKKKIIYIYIYQKQLAAEIVLLRHALIFTN
jgi:hypothetical protein